VARQSLAKDIELNPAFVPSIRLLMILVILFDGLSGLWKGGSKLPENSACLIGRLLF
jgi:hypothetical protein